MSLMAGFDFVAEISNETLLKFLEKNLKIGGVAISPPFELTLPLHGDAASGTSLASGTAHLIVTDLQLDLNTDDTITLTLTFDRASVALTAPLALTLCPLDGNFTIKAPIQLVKTVGSNEQVSVDLASAVVAIVWSPATQKEIDQYLSGPLAMFASLPTQMLTSYVHSIPAATLPLGFQVVAGADGSLSPTLQFERLEVHCIPNAQRSQQALGLFGILLLANDANGDHSQKTSTAITAAHDGVCISIAPGAFHSLVFCPAIATALGTDVSMLPGSCGPAGGFSTQGVTIHSISDSFATGHIDISGSVSKSGFCYDATGTFMGTLAFPMSSTGLSPSLHIDPPNVDVEILWYCWLAGSVVFGPIGIVVMGIVNAIVNAVANKLNLSGAMLTNTLVGGIPGIGTGGLSQVSLSSAPITREGISLQGTLPIFVPHPFVTPMLSLSGSVMTIQSQTVDSGTLHAQIWCMPDAKDYPYTEYSLQQKGIYQLSGVMVSKPLTPHYSITLNGTTMPLVGASGSIALPNVDTHYPMPLATGGTAMQQTVHIGYAISGTSVELTNVASEGDYGFRLYVTATDCKGNPVENDTGDTLTTWADVQFEGDHVDVGNSYAADVQHCAQEGLGSSFNSSAADRLPSWPPVNYPPPEALIKYILDLIAVSTPQADGVLIASKIAHGNSFYRALFSPAARQPALLTANSDITQKRQTANISRE